jgi:hypothetical protein
MTPFTLTFQGEDAGDGDRVPVPGQPDRAIVRLVNPDDGKTWVETWPWPEFENRAAAIGLVITMGDPIEG